MSEDLICEVCKRVESETMVQFSSCWVGTLDRVLCEECYRKEIDELEGHDKP